MATVAAVVGGGEMVREGGSGRRKEVCVFGILGCVFGVYVY